MADRVRMKSKSTFDNPFIFNHTKEREGRTTVQEEDEFSTEPEHADQLVQADLAERINGDVSDRTERQEKLIGTQTPAGTGIAANRPAAKATPAAGTATKPAA